MSLNITLLGQPRILLNDKPISEITLNKAYALLYYLAVSRVPHSRQGLAGLLWTDDPECNARQSLVKALEQLHSALKSYISINGQYVEFCSNNVYQLDIEDFEAGLRHPNPTVVELQKAVDLYQGDFLENFSVNNAALFEEWLTNKRMELRQSASRLTLRLINLLIQQKQYNLGILYSQRILTREIWQEEVHQRLMYIYARLGQLNSALEQYEICCQALTQNFGVEPGIATKELYNKIKEGIVTFDSEILYDYNSPVRRPLYAHAIV